ncbi:hypothetical protein ACIG3E_33210 [Streptomyces sp. NPDC053474]|uniref:hypothetical protein n=1 Tax=Streptomyces sp. NPDC053474 TaxID=3365704 RepID=UPI0037D27256
MTALLIPPPQWRMQLTERPSPIPGRAAMDVVQVGVGLGGPALAPLMERGMVGPVLICPRHQLLHVPVVDQASAWWRRAPHSQCRPGQQWQCTDLAECGPAQPCCRVWLLPPCDVPFTADAARSLFDGLSTIRAQMSYRPRPRESFSQDEPMADWPAHGVPIDDREHVPRPWVPTSSCA